VRRNDRELDAFCEFLCDLSLVVRICFVATSNVLTALVIAEERSTVQVFFATLTAGNRAPKLGRAWIRVTAVFDGV
jgi:hypothetical protein